MRQKHKYWFYKIRQKPQSNKQLLWVNCHFGYWEMKYLWEAALRNYQICLFLLRVTDRARAGRTRSGLSSCNSFSFLREAALQINFRTSFTFFFFLRKNVKNLSSASKSRSFPYNWYLQAESYDQRQVRCLPHWWNQLSRESHRLLARRHLAEVKFLSWCQWSNFKDLQVRF